MGTIFGKNQGNEIFMLIYHIKMGWNRIRAIEYGKAHLIGMILETCIFLFILQFIMDKQVLYSLITDWLEPIIWLFPFLLTFFSFLFYLHIYYSVFINRRKELALRTLMGASAMKLCCLAYAEILVKVNVAIFTAVALIEGFLFVLQYLFDLYMVIPSYISWMTILITWGSFNLLGLVALMFFRIKIKTAPPSILIHQNPRV